MINEATRPILSLKLERVLAPIHRFFDWLFHSKYNPLYRSGALAVGLLFILLGTGIYLVIFYSVADPYGSVEKLQLDFMGRLIRTVHRYATDFALLAVGFHFLQILVHGKTWGPRLIAWVSGVILLGALLLSAWTGYVMVWDAHGQLLALSGAKLAQVFPFMSEFLGQAFDGSNPVTGSFFFMNLFLHVAVPLIMVFGIWVHTIRLARSDWFPGRRILYWITAALIVGSIIIPAPLGQKANLLVVLGKLRGDWLTSFWTSAVFTQGSLTILLYWLLATILALSFPLWWRLKRTPDKSSVDPETCSGCTQCVLDCPYGAISMAPKPDGKRLYAIVNPTSCVSCAICAASCDDLAIGPANRNGIDQMSRARELIAKDFQNVTSKDVLLIHCEHNNQVAALSSSGNDVHLFTTSVDCCGTIHSNALEHYLGKFGGVFIWGCPEGNCLNRDGFELLRQRTYEKRVPFLDRKIDRSRVLLSAGSSAEAGKMKDSIQNFVAKINMQQTQANKAFDIGLNLRRIVATTLIFILVAWLSQVELGSEQTSGLLRLSTRIPGESKQNCRELSEEEKRSIPKHMQSPKICTTDYLTFELVITVDGQKKLTQTIVHSGVHKDSPLFVTAEVELAPGDHDFTVNITPSEQQFSANYSLILNQKLKVIQNKIYLVAYNPELKSLQLLN